MINRECGVFKTTYQADMALYGVPLARYTVIALLLFFAIAFPFLVGVRYLIWTNLVFIAIVSALGLHILLGLAGQISIGQAAFMATGAYTAAILSDRYGQHFLVGILAGGILAAVYGLIVGLPSLRVKGFYLAIATLAAQFITEWTINHVTWISGGFQASIPVPYPELGPLVLNSEQEKYFFLLVFALIAIVAALNIGRSRMGRALVAIRDREVAAEIIGVNVFRYKLLAFVISSFYAGVAGALWGYYLGNVSIETFTIRESILYLTMIIVGGLGSVLGTIFGAVFITVLPFLLDDLLEAMHGILPVSDVTTFASQLRLMVFGGLIVLFLMVEPEGLASLWRRIKDYFRLWPFAY